MFCREFYCEYHDDIYEEIGNDLLKIDIIIILPFLYSIVQYAYIHMYIMAYVEFSSKNTYVPNFKYI